MRSFFRTCLSAPGSAQTAKSTITQVSELLLAEASVTTGTFSFTSSNTAASASSTEDGGGGGGLSQGAMYGIGIAAGSLALAIAATLGGCYFPRRRNERKQNGIALAPQQSGVGTFSGNKPREDGNFAGSEQRVSLLKENGIPKDSIDNVAEPPHQDHTPGGTMSPRYYRLAAPPVYELPMYARGNRPSKHEPQGSDTEDMSISSLGPESRWQSPAASPRSLYSNGRRYTPPAVDLSDTHRQLNPRPFSPASGPGVIYPSQAHAAYTANLAGNKHMVPLSPLPQLESPGSPGPTLSRAMSPQHSIQGYVVSPRHSRDSWGVLTKVHDHNRRGSGFEDARGN